MVLSEENGLFTNTSRLQCREKSLGASSHTLHEMKKEWKGHRKTYFNEYNSYDKKTENYSLVIGFYIPFPFPIPL
jgi:hypothetical protein